MNEGEKLVEKNRSKPTHTPRIQTINIYRHRPLRRGVARLRAVDLGCQVGDRGAAQACAGVAGGVREEMERCFGVGWAQEGEDGEEEEEREEVGWGERGDGAEVRGVR